MINQEEEKQLKILNEATDRALVDIQKKRKSKSIDFISEFHDWYKLVSKYLKQMISN